MTKHFCDRCGKQVGDKDLEDVEVPDVVIANSPRSYGICKTCLMALHRWIGTSAATEAN